MPTNGSHADAQNEEVLYPDEALVYVLHHDKPSLRLENFVPEPEDVVVDGVPVHIKYRDSYYGYCADLYIDFDAAQQLTRLPEVQSRDSRFPSLITIHLTSPGVEGDLFPVYFRSIAGLQQAIREYKLRQNRVKRQQESEDKLNDLMQQYYDLLHLGRPVEKLSTLLQKARLTINRMTSWYAVVSYEAVVTAIRTVENEIERIKDGGSQLLVNDLLNGSIFHPHVVANQKTLAAIDVFSIRTGNVLETAFTEGRLYDFYMERLAEITHTSQLESCDLLISLDDYVLEESELDGFEVAPTAIELPSNKGTKSYEVTYAYKDIDGHKTAVATIRVPYKVYDEIGYEYGRKTRLPQLPHGILWAFEVTLGDNVLASGLDTKDLRSNVERHKKGIERGGKLTNAERNSFEATPLPPWAVGVRTHRR